jgi:hypothetical protein
MRNICLGDSQQIDRLLKLMESSSANVQVTPPNFKLSPDTLYIPDALPLMHGLLRQLANMGVTGLRLMSVYSAQSDDVLTAVGKGGEGLILSYRYNASEAWNRTLAKSEAIPRAQLAEHLARQPVARALPAPPDASRCYPTPDTDSVEIRSELPSQGLISPRSTVLL